MPQLAHFKLDDGTEIYMEADEDMVAPVPTSSEGTTRTSKGAGDAALQKFEAMQGTIKTYTSYTLNAFKERIRQ